MGCTLRPRQPAVDSGLQAGRGSPGSVVAVAGGPPVGCRCAFDCLYDGSTSSQASLWCSGQERARTEQEARSPRSLLGPAPAVLLAQVPSGPLEGDGGPEGGQDTGATAVANDAPSLPLPHSCPHPSLPIPCSSCPPNRASPVAAIAWLCHAPLEAVARLHSVRKPSAGAHSGHFATEQDWGEDGFWPGAEPVAKSVLWPGCGCFGQVPTARNRGCSRPCASQQAPQWHRNGQRAPA